MMNNYDLVIWDFNGTLMDDAWLCLEVMNDMLARRGLRTLSPQQYERYFDFPVRDYYRRAGWNFDRYPFELLSDEFMAGYHARKLECSLRPEAKAMLESLQAAGLEQVIISAAQQSMVDELLGYFGIRPYFASVLGLDNHHAAGKLEVGADWMAKQEIDPQRAVLIGDTYHDFEVAEAMGVDCVLIYSGHQSIGKLQTTEAKVVTALDQIEFGLG